MKFQTDKDQGHALHINEHNHLVQGADGSHHIINTKSDRTYGPYKTAEAAITDHHNRGRYNPGKPSTTSQVALQQKKNHPEFQKYVKATSKMDKSDLFKKEKEEIAQFFGKSESKWKKVSNEYGEDHSHPHYGAVSTNHDGTGYLSYKHGQEEPVGSHATVEEAKKHLESLQE